MHLWSSGSFDTLISSSQTFRCLSRGVMNHQTAKFAWARWKIFSSSSKSVQNPTNRPIDYPIGQTVVHMFASHYLTTCMPEGHAYYTLSDKEMIQIMAKDITATTSCPRLY